jgi:ABC-type branched-subunit amino acid transport system substrate-binding protein
MKKNWKLIAGGVIVLAILASLFYGLTKDSQPKEALRIGGVLPLTGSQAYYGTPYSQGAQAAVTKINQTDPGRIEFVVEDTKSDTKEAVSAFKFLKEVKQADVYYTIFTGNAKAIIPLAKEQQAIVMGDIASKGVVESYPLAYSMFYDTTEKCQALAEQAIKDGAKKIIAPTLNMELGLNCTKGIKKAAAAANVAVAEYVYNLEDKDFSTLANKIKQDNQTEQTAMLMCTYES